MKFSQYLQPTASNVIPQFKNLTQQQYDAATGQHCEEYRLVAIPPDLKTFAILCNYNKKQPNVVRFVWITDNAFVTWNEWLCSEPLTLGLKVNGGRYNYCRIFSATVVGLRSALDLLFSLPDTFFTKVRILECGYVADVSLRETFFTRFRGSVSPSLMEKLLLQNPRRETAFQGMYFTPEQWRVLATAGTRTCITLRDCSCCDGGLAFAEASASRNDPDAGPAHLNLKQHCPFKDKYLETIFNTRDSISLEQKTLFVWAGGTRREERTPGFLLATRTLRKLEIQGCDFCDRMLMRTLRDVPNHPFWSNEKLAPILTAIRCSTRLLESLDLYLPFILEQGQAKAIAGAIAANKSLQYVSLGWWNGDTNNLRGGGKWGWENWRQVSWEGWNALIQALVGHTSIQTLDLTRTDAFTTDLPGPILDVAFMVKENRQIDSILLNDSIVYHGGYWDDLVVPLLDCNKYRKLIPTMQKIQSPRTRAAIMGKALGMESCKPNITWMLLSQNCDVLSNYLS